MKTVAILPAYNLESSIAGIVNRAKRYSDIVIVVSDGSRDNTNQRAAMAGAVCPAHTYNRGKGYAVRKGIEFSKQFSPDVLILMDTDGQHLPEEIPVLLEPLKNGGDIDMVVGSRMMGQLSTSIVNKIGNFGLKIISFLVTFRWFTDTESGFRAIKADKLYDLKLDTMRYEIESELLLKALKKNYRVREVPITVPVSVPGVTVADGLRMGYYKLKTGLLLKIGG
jgi:glycosyltransferase involved in cell wall biosynthesis